MNRFCDLLSAQKNLYISFLQRVQSPAQGSKHCQGNNLLWGGLGMNFPLCWYLSAGAVCDREPVLRTIKWFGLERILKIIPFHPLATFYWTKLLQCLTLWNVCLSPLMPECWRHYVDFPLELLTCVPPLAHPMCLQDMYYSPLAPSDPQQGGQSQQGGLWCRRIVWAIPESTEGAVVMDTNMQWEDPVQLRSACRPLACHVDLWSTHSTAWR